MYETKSKTLSYILLILERIFKNLKYTLIRFNKAALGGILLKIWKILLSALILWSVELVT